MINDNRVLSIEMSEVDGQYLYEPLVNDKSMCYDNFFVDRELLLEKYPEFEDISVSNTYMFPKLIKRVSAVLYKLNFKDTTAYYNKYLKENAYTTKLLMRYNFADLNYVVDVKYMNALLKTIEAFYMGTTDFRDSYNLINLEMGLLIGAKINTKKDKLVELDSMGEKWFNILEGKISRQAIKVIENIMNDVIDSERDDEIKDDYVSLKEHLARDKYSKDELIKTLNSWDFAISNAFNGTIVTNDTGDLMSLKPLVEVNLK